jgi:hypothetical protein
VLTAGTDHELETAFAAAVEQKVGALFINIDSSCSTSANKSPR